MDSQLWSVFGRILEKKMAVISSNIRYTKSLAVAFAQFIEARCSVENEDVVSSADRRWFNYIWESTILLPTKVQLIWEVWRKSTHCIGINGPYIPNDNKQRNFIILGFLVYDELQFSIHAIFLVYLDHIIIGWFLNLSSYQYLLAWLVFCGYFFNFILFFVIFFCLINWFYIILITSYLLINWFYILITSYLLLTFCLVMFIYFFRHYGVLI